MAEAPSTPAKVIDEQLVEEIFTLINVLDKAVANDPSTTAKDIEDESSIVAKALEEVVAEESSTQAMEFETATTTAKDLEDAEAESPTPLAKDLEDVVDVSTAKDPMENKKEEIPVQQIL